MSESKTIATLRRMAWQRVKGELNAILVTYWTEYRFDGSKINNGFDDVSTIIEQFISDMEDAL